MIHDKQIMNIDFRFFICNVMQVAFKVFHENKFQKILENAVKAATKRSKKLNNSG